MHTEMYCSDLAALDPLAAIRAIHQAHLQLAEMGLRPEIDGTTFDNASTLTALWDCLKSVGYAGAV